MVTQAVILAGGLGTRLQPFTLDNPKPMIPIEGVPFLEHTLNQLKSWGIKEVVLLLGYLPDKIQQYFKNGSKWGIEITYCITPVEYDTGARLYRGKELFKDEFILLYCDNFCPINFEEAYQQFCESGNLIQITAYANKDGYTKNNLLIEDGQVTVYDKKRKAPNLQGVDIGYIFMKKQVLDYLTDENVNFEARVYPQIIEQNKLGGYMTEHRYYSIGSWERIDLTKEFFRPKKVIFLDRDGTLNVRAPKACYIKSPEQFVWLEHAKEAVLELKRKGYQIYLITNQPGIARGMVSWEDIDAIHEKMCRELHDIGAQLDGIYMCPHGWNDGCECRKPKPGMLFQAQKEHSLDLTKCLLIGDDDRDIEAGQAANLEQCILVTDTFSLWDAVQQID